MFFPSAHEFLRIQDAQIDALNTEKPTNLDFSMLWLQRQTHVHGTLEFVTFGATLAEATWRIENVLRTRATAQSRCGSSYTHVF